MNGYDHVRIVDSSYRSKYFITMMQENDRSVVPENLLGTKYEASCILLRNPEKMQDYGEIARLHSKTGFLSNIRENCVESSNKENSDMVKTKFLAPVETDRSQAIFPWINGDGSTNDVVYNGLVRRILGIVMQNPGILEVYKYYDS